MCFSEPLSSERPVLLLLSVPLEGGASILLLRSADFVYQSFSALNETACVVFSFPPEIGSVHRPVLVCVETKLFFLSFFLLLLLVVGLFSKATCSRLRLNEQFVFLKLFAFASYSADLVCFVLFQYTINLPNSPSSQKKQLFLSQPLSIPTLHLCSSCCYKERQANKHKTSKHIC